MVAVITSKTYGLEQGSGFVLGSRGQWGQSAIGRANENVFVNAATGNLVVTNTDEMLIGLGLDAIVSRTYNSLGGWDGDNGDQWRAGLYRRVTGLTGSESQPGSTITRTDWDGSESVYSWDAIKSAYVGTDGAGAYDTLTYDAGNKVWTWTDGNSRIREYYDANYGGRITSSVDTDGNALTYDYEPVSGLLTKVTTADGQDTTLSYTSGLLTELVTHHGTGTLSTFTRVRYEYDTNTPVKRLIKVTVDLSPSDNIVSDGKTYYTEYTYHGTSNRVASIIQKDGSSLSITYDGSNRVSTLTQAISSGVTRVTTIGYGTNTATITDESGQVTTLNYDTNKQLTSIVAPPPVSGGSSQATVFAYNSRGDVTSVTDPTTKGVVYDATPSNLGDVDGYDDNGNRTWERDTAGNIIRRTFDTNTNSLLTETRYTVADTGSGASGPMTTRYAYDGENHLRYVVSAEGYVTEFVYGTSGLQTSAIQYAGHVYNVSSLSPSTAISEGALDYWVGTTLTDKSTAKRVDRTYNYRGQIWTETSYGKTTTAGAGDTTATTEITKLIYVYDQAGNLKSRQLDGSTTESFLYDGLNRLYFSSDHNGLETTIVFGDSPTTTTTVTIGAVMTRTSTYNLAGELVSVMESASGTTTDTTTYRYDRMGRLRGVTDQTGVKSFYIYDRIGRLVGEVDGTGALTEYGYDADGLLIRTVKYKTLVSSTLLNQLDSNTLNFDHELSAYRPSADAADVWEWRLYDNAQRLVETIDGLGAVTTFTYDGASRLIGTTQHGNRIDAATITGFKTTAPTLTTAKPPRTATASTAPAGYTTTASATSGADTMTGTSGSDFVDGLGGNDALSGGTGGADILIGGTGNDSLTGGAGTGKDIFVFRPGDGVDTIADFSQAQADLIDLSAHTTYSSRAQLSVVLDGGNTVITLGDGSTITLTGFTSALTDADFIFADRTARQFYDDGGRLEATLDAEGFLTRFIYDSAGQLVQTWAYATASPLADRTSTLANLILHTSSSTNDIHGWTIYDRRGLALVKINGEGDVVRYQYTALGHVEQEIRGQKLTSDELTTQRSTPYTLAGLPTAVSGTVLERTDWTRDHYGRVLSETRTLASGTETDVYLYDSFGRLMSVTVASGTGEARTKTYRYDNQGRLTGEMSGEGDTVLSAFGNWTYDGSPIIGTTGVDTLNGTTGRDLIQGLAGNDTLNGLDGDDRLEGGAGVDVMNGGDGNDVIVSGLNNDTSLTGGAGRDVFVFVAGDGSDTIMDFQVGVDLIDLRAVGTYNSITTSGADTLINLAGGGVVRVKNTTIAQLTANNFLMTSYDQRLTGTTGADSLTGGAGRDLLLGLGGNDTLLGWAGNDRLDGGAGADIINGGDGDDIVINGTSNDTSISGGAGRDTFVFLPGDGTDTILDFQVGLDLIDLSALGSYTSLTTVGAHTRINLASGSITVNNVTVAQLTAANFIYSAADVFRAYGTTYAYDEADRLISKTESDGTVTGGNKTLFYYDKDGRLTHTINALGEVVEYRYDSVGRQTNVVTYGTRLSSLSGLVGGLMTTGLASNLSSLASGADSAVTTTYDITGRVTNVSTAGGKSTDYAYGAFDEAVTKRDKLTTAPTYRTAVMTHDRRGLMASSTADFGGLNLTTSAVYDAFGRAINTTDADGKVRQTGYDRAGRVLTTTDPLGKVTTYEYDGRGAVVTIKDRTWTWPTDNKTTFTYTAFNRQVVMTTAQGLATTTVNNAFGQTLTITDGAGRKVSYSYDRNGDLLNTIVDEGSGTLNLTSQSVHDRGGRLSWTIDAAGSKTSFTYDAVGRLLTSKVDDGVLGLTTTYGYDAKGQQTTVTDAAGRVTQVAFDLDGQTTMVTADPTGLKISTKYEYDLVGRTVKVSQGTGTNSFTATKVTDYVYDNADRLTDTYVDQSGLNLTTKYQYDKRGNVVLKTEVIGGGNPDALTRYVYDDDNRLIWTVDATGAVTKTAYDAEGRVTSTRGYVNMVTAGTMTSWAADPIAATDITVTTTTADRQSIFVYDHDGRLRYTIDGLNRVVELIYDNSGNVTQKTVYATAITVPGTLTVATVAAAITTNAADRTTKAIFDAAGRQTHSIDAIGAVTAFEYDGTGKVTVATQYASLYTSGTFSTWLSTHAADADNRVSRTVYDGAGRVAQRIDGIGAVTAFEYDGSGNVAATTGFSLLFTASFTPAAFATWLTAHAADAGNRVNSAKYDAAGRQTHSIDGIGSVTAFEYDALGNVTTSTLFAALYTTGTFSTWLTSHASDADNRVSRAYYDAAGRQIQRVDAVGAVTAFQYDGASDVTAVTRYGALYASGTFSAWLSAHLTDADNRITRTFYDGAGRATISLDAENYVTQIAYDASGAAVKTIRYATKLTTSPTLANLQTFITAQASNADNVVERTLYDAAGRATYSVDGETYVTKFVYDALGNVTDRIRLAGKYTVGDSETVATLTTAIGTIPSTAVIVHMTYDAAGRMLTEVRGYGDVDPSTKTYAYDSAGRAISVTNGRGYATLYEYDAVGNLTKKTAPLDSGLNAVTVFEYDAFHGQIRITDPRGFVGYSYYNKAGRLTLQTDPGGYATATEYSIGGEVTKIIRYLDASTNAFSTTVLPTLSTDPTRLAETVMTRDKLDRVTDVIDAMGKAERYDLNAFGDRIKVWNRLTTSRSGVFTENTYDRRGLLIEEKLPITVNKIGGGTLTGVINSYSYDSRGNRLTAIEANNPNGSGGYALAERRTTTFEYDKLDRLTKEIGDQVATVTSGLTAGSSVYPTQTINYDAFGNIRESIDAGGYRTLYWYDELGRKTDQVSPLGTLSHWTYDDADNATSVKVYDQVKVISGATAWTAADATPPLGAGYRETTSTYDYNNRLKTTSVSGLRTGEYNGTTFSTASGVTVTTQRVYNALGGVTQQIDGRGNVIYQMFDKNGRVIAKVDQENYLTTFDVDSEGNVKTETRYATPLTASGATLVGLTTSVTSLSDTALTTLITTSSTDDRITQFTYDENGRRLTETRLNVVAYNIDAAGDGDLTLRTGSADDATIAYTYDGLGGVTRKVEANGDTSDFEYDAIGRMTRMQGAEFTGWLTASTTGLVRHTTDYSYDGIGNVVQTREGKAATDSTTDRITTFVYGAGGRLTSMTDATGFTRSYGYDAAGHVVKEEYTRYNGSSTTALIEATLYVYDAMGRVIQQATASKPSSAWEFGERTHIAYNVFGEMTGRGITAGTETTPTYQETFAYDTAGRMWKSNTGDGSTRLHVYDANGAATLTINATTTTSIDLAGYANIEDAMSGLGASNATGGAYLAGIAPTITVYDKRGQATSTREHFREVDDSGTETIVRSRAYNAFGEVKSETDARGSGYTTDFSYNTMGRLIQKQAPTVSVTAENGAQSNVRPTDNYYFDISGRLIGVEDANSNLNKRALLAGSGHGDDEAIVTADFRAGGADTTSSGIFRSLADVHGDLRTLTNELGAVEKRDYDKMGRLTTLTRPSRGSSTPGGAVTGLVEHYVYDGLGHRTAHSQDYALSGSPQTRTETTDYDAQGRVLKFTDYAGHQTNYVYVWTPGLATSGLGSFGGIVKTTTEASGLTSTDSQDYFGHLVSHKDLGNHTYTMTYDEGGRLASKTSSAGQNILYSYFNTGQMSQVIDGLTTATYELAKYSYDLAGNRLTESQVMRNATTVFATRQTATVTYDAMNRMVSYTDPGSVGGTATINFEYDAVGNIRRMLSVYHDIGASGTTTQYYWYKYDSMNRFVLTKGAFTGTRGSGSIGRGTGNRFVTGVNIEYDAAGQRVAAISNTSVSVPNGGHYVRTWNDEIDEWEMVWHVDYTSVTSDHREEYVYTEDGYLSAVKIADAMWNGSAVVVPTATVRATDVRNALGQVLAHTEYKPDGTTVVYTRTAQYDLIGLVTADQTTTLMVSNGWLSHADTTYSYVAQTTDAYVTAGAFLGGVATYSLTDNYHYGSGGGYYNDPNNTLTTTYEWWDGARQSQVRFDPDASTPSTYNTSTFSYDVNGRTTSVAIADGRPRTVSLLNNMDGQILERIDNGPESLDPRDVYYYFAGLKVGNVGNNWHDGADYAEAIGNRGLAPGTGQFRNGSTYAAPFADFDQSYDIINPGSTRDTGSSYTVGDGDTLQGIAQTFWGDASLWYLIAQANGLTSADNLIAGTSLVIPNKVANAHNNSDTFRPYDPNAALGNVTPTQPKPPPKADKGCGPVGTIIMVIVAIVVTIYTAGAASSAFASMGASTTAAGTTVAGTTAGIASGTIATVGTSGIAASSMAGIMGSVVGAAVGSIASQAVGVAMGNIDKISWNAVALSAVTAGVASGLSAAPVFNNAMNLVPDALRGYVAGAVVNTVTQGVAVATGLQDKFSWTSVAVAAVVSGVSSNVADTKWFKDLDPAIRDTVANAVGGITGAAAQSLFTGSDFGDNLLAALPDIIGSTVGNMIAAQLPPIDFNSRDVVDAPTIIDHGFEPVTASTHGQTEPINLLPGLPADITADTSSAPAAETYSTNGHRGIHLSWNDDGFGTGDGIQSPTDVPGVRKPVVKLRGIYERGEDLDRLNALLNVDGVDEHIEIVSSPDAKANWDVAADEDGAWGYLATDPSKHTEKITWQTYIENRLANDTVFADQHEYKLTLAKQGVNFEFANTSALISGHDRIRQPFSVGNYYSQFGRYHPGREYQVIDDGQVERIVETQRSLDRRAEFDRGQDRRKVMAGGPFGGLVGAKLAIDGDKTSFDRFAEMAAAADNVLMSVGVATNGRQSSTARGPRIDPLIDGTSRNLGYRDIAAERATVIDNNGWRTLDGKFASPLGAGRPGGSAEVGVWDAIAAKPGWSVRTGNVAVRDASGQLRFYDGIAISPRDRIIGLEVKSGDASRTAAQRLFDTTLNSSPSNVATGVGQSVGTTVKRSILIRPGQ